MDFLRLFKRCDPAVSGLGQAAWLQPSAAAAGAHRTTVVPASQPVRSRAGAAAPAVMPDLLTAYRPMRVEQLDSAGRQALARMFHGVMPPPQALQVLRALVHDNEADPVALAAWLAAQDAQPAPRPGAAPRARAARQTGPTGVAGSLRDLDPASARGLAFAWVLRELFPGRCAPSRQRLAVLGVGAAIGCLLADAFARTLDRPDTSELQARVALACVGPMAVVHRLPEALLDRLPRGGFLQRCVAEQALLGVSSAEIGRLSMREWALPEALVDDACQVDAVLFAPHAAWTPARAGSLALCYLATRSAERLAQDPTLQPHALDPLNDPDPALHQLRAYLRQPGLRGVCEALRAPGLSARLRRLCDRAPSASA